MPFGLVVSQENCFGTIAIADVVVFGKTEEGHDTNLHLFDIPKQQGLTSNGAKCMVNHD